jgi:hypothetical protein
MVFTNEDFVNGNHQQFPWMDWPSTPPPSEGCDEKTVNALDLFSYPSALYPHPKKKEPAESANSL